MGVKVYKKNNFCTVPESPLIKTDFSGGSDHLLLQAVCKCIHPTLSEEHASQRMRCNICKFHSSSPGGAADLPPSFLTSVFFLLSMLIFKTNQSQDQKSCSQNKANKNKIKSNPSICRAKIRECPVLCFGFFAMPYDTGSPGANKQSYVTAWQS